ncbi:MAG: hypothetical protein KIS76_00470 [Pyrinomonadaceae bacterium]|nr:hypothetical protein [Pyrinomonadaceae bacterium]
MSKSICFGVLIFLSSQIAFGQEINVKVQACDATTARQMVEQQAIESRSISDLEKRINILIRVAEFLWEKDNESARTYFSDAFKLAVDRFAETGVRNISKSQFLLEREKDYRFIVANKVLRKDPEWGKKLLEQILKSWENDKSVADRAPYERGEEIRQSFNLAISLIESNEVAALSILNRLIGYPLESYWNQAFYQLHKKNPAAANQLFYALVQKHSQAPVSKLLTLSGFPLGRNQPLSLFAYYSGPVFRDNYVADAALQKFYLKTVLLRISSLSAETLVPEQSNAINEAGFGIAAVNAFSDVIVQSHPDLRADLSRASATANSLLDATTKEKIDSSKKYQERMAGSFADKIAALEEAESKGTLTDFQIVQLILDAKTEEKLNALEPWLDKIKDASVKEKSVNFFYFTSSKVALDEKRFTDARKFADMVPQIEHRAVLYFNVADEKLKGELTKFETLELLTDVLKTAEKSPDTVEKAQVLLGVAFMFEKIDRFNSIDALSKAISTANKLENPNLFTQYVSQHIVGKDFGVFSSYPVPGFDINRTFDQISKEDFAGAISQAQSFSDRYLRTLAILASVTNCEKPVKEKMKVKTTQ